MSRPDENKGKIMWVRVGPGKYERALIDHKGHRMFIDADPPKPKRGRPPKTEEDWG
jgi:hypothetical protein